MFSKMEEDGITEKVPWIDVGDNGVADNNHILEDHYLNDIESDGESLSLEDESADPSTGEKLPNEGMDVKEGDQNLKTCKTPVGFSSVVGQLIRPLSNVWCRFALQRRETSVTKLVRQYCNHLLSSLTVEDIPPDAVAIFESILDHDITACSVGNDGSSNNVDLKTNRLIEVSQFPAHGVLELCNLLETSLKMMETLSLISATLNERLNIDCMIQLDTVEHQLCNQLHQSLVALLVRLSVLSGVAKRLFKDALKNSIFGGVLNFPDIANLSSLQSRFCFDILTSTMSDVEILCAITIESINRFIAFLSCMWCQDLNNERKLVGLTADVTISIQEFYKAVIYYQLECSHATEAVKMLDTLPESLENSVSKIFSREHKILTQYKAIHHTSTQLVDRIAVVEGLSSKLNDSQENIEDCDGLTNQILMEHSAAEQLLKDLRNLMDSQTLLITQLKRTQKSTSNCETCPGKSLQHTKDERPVTKAKDEEDIVQPNEFQTHGTEDYEETNSTENADEVFVGMFLDDDLSNENEPTSSFDVEQKLATQLYSGVVNQQRSALVPVKTKMQQREKDAIKKVYGNVEDVSDDESDLDGLGSLPEKDISTKKSKPACDYSSECYEETNSDYENDEYPERESFNLAFGNPFMAELKSKMNKDLYPMLFGTILSFYHPYHFTYKSWRKVMYGNVVGNSIL